MSRKFLPLLLILGVIGIWLLLWDLIDFLTLGINEGIWNWTIIQQGYPSIFIGFIIVSFVTICGVKVIK